MDIRTKLILSFVLVSLFSMALLGYFYYQTSSEILQEITTRQLEALAESRQDDLESVYRSWLDQVQLIRFGTPMRQLLKQQRVEPDGQQLLQVETILQDAMDAVAALRRITVYSLEGERLVSVGDAEIAPVFRYPASGEITLGGTHPLTRGDVLVVLDAPIVQDGEVIATLEIVRDAADIYSVTSDFTGLGETGETYIVVEDSAGKIRVLNPLRHDESIEPRVIEAGTASADVAGVLRGLEQIYKSDILDYRGIPVWSATRYLADMNWGLVVKVDEEEEMSRIIQQRDIMIDLALTLCAFTVIGGMVLGLVMARPVQELVEAVEQIREGDMGVRIPVRGDDEIAYLADSVNDLLDDMERQGVVLSRGVSKPDD